MTRNGFWRGAFWYHTNSARPACSHLLTFQQSINKKTDDRNDAIRSGIIISSSNRGQWRWTAATSFTGVMVGPVARRRWRRGTSLGASLLDYSSNGGSGRIINSCSNVRRCQQTAVAAYMGALVDQAARRQRSRDTSLGIFLPDYSSVSGSGRIIISSSNDKQWWQTAAAASTEAAVEPAARRWRHRGTSSGGVLTDDSSVGGSGRIIISSNNGGQWQRTASGFSSNTPIALWYQLRWFLTDGGSVGGSGRIIIRSNNGRRLG